MSNVFCLVLSTHFISYPRWLIWMDYFSMDYCVFSRVWPTLSWRANKDSEVRLIIHWDSFQQDLCYSTKTMLLLMWPTLLWFLLVMGSGNLSFPSSLWGLITLMWLAWVSSILHSLNYVYLFEDTLKIFSLPGFYRLFQAKTLPELHLSLFWLL